MAIVVPFESHPAPALGPCFLKRSDLRRRLFNGKDSINRVVGIMYAKKLTEG